MAAAQQRHVPVSTPGVMRTPHEQAPSPTTLCRTLISNLPCSILVSKSGTITYLTTARSEHSIFVNLPQRRVRSHHTGRGANKLIDVLIRTGSSSLNRFSIYHSIGPRDQLRLVEITTDYSYSLARKEAAIANVGQSTSKTAPHPGRSNRQWQVSRSKLSWV